ncbi:hypothetical protein SARC_11804 [Sphaeroforma arctica JP610]|uniref:Uncharacterized protein n=1 Tax=Sphaeroforma arctica JP610 TaxID=667725 RepID=A0A0L0FGU0_9EUKA|nr:hypothetical protein SARC_11804 [Sphaeroforma arctica JP610]KNC75676.1 hypothetical protein SARC_11804 [Sphaeroforma arctica JP610]|eukprot:XP_014149578.1 hypothetical protein SARC_11804 [Sphaeroforma arctica JP610]
MKYVSAVFASLALAAHGAVISADATNYVGAFASAQDGDTIILTAGPYALTEPIILDKKLNVTAEPGTIFQVADLSSIVFAFGNMAGYSSTLDGLSIATATGDSCDLAEPYALQANFSIDITGATVASNKVNLKTDVGVWHNERKLNDFYFAECHYAVDHPTKMSGGVYKLLGNCRAQLDFSVDFDKLGGTDGCGTTIENFATFTSYRAQVEAQWDEFVEKVDDEKELRLPVTREGNAVTNLLVQIDTVRNVAATINAKYKSVEIEAAINLVDVGYYDSWNHSKIRLEIHLPAPYTVTNAMGVVGRNEESFEAEVSALSSYSVEPACVGQAIGDDCIQNVEFDIVACDLTGEYSLNELTIGCQAEDNNGDPGVCPNMDAEEPATVIFFIDTNNFCEIEEFELDALFDLSIKVYDSDAYVVEQDTFDLGSMSYWQITADTSASGVALYNAEVTYAERTTDGDCSGFDDYLGEIAALEEGEFTQTYEPIGQTISIPLQVTAQMACATSDRTGNAITMNYTVLVDYDDGSARRRRALDGMSTRDAGEVAVDKEAGVRYTAEDLAQAAAVGASVAAGATAAQQEEQGDTILIVGGILILLLLCCCCCCLVVGVVIMRRRKAARQKEEAILSQQSNMGFNSSVNFGGHASQIKV